MKYKYVCLEGIEHGNRFYSLHTEGTDPTRSASGEIWYRILGYANTDEEAQRIIYPRPGMAAAAIVAYMLTLAEQVHGEAPLDGDEILNMFK